MIQFGLDQSNLKMGIELICKLIAKAVAVTCEAAELVRKTNSSDSHGDAKQESQKHILKYLKHHFPKIILKTKDEVFFNNKFRGFS